jgi:hypothetical protein
MSKKKRNKQTNKNNWTRTNKRKEPKYNIKHNEKNYIEKNRRERGTMPELDTNTKFSIKKKTKRTTKTHTA